MKRVMLFIIMTGLIWSLNLPLSAQGAQNEKIRPALLVIDIQNAYLPRMDEKDVKFGMEMINYYIGLFRSSGFPIIRVYHSDLKMGPKTDSEEFKFPKTVAVLESDPEIVKHYGNAFKKTDLDKLLKEKGCNTLFLCGLSAVGCVLSTYHGANDLDYSTFMLKDGLISHDAELTKAVQQISRTIDYYAVGLVLRSLKN